MVKLQGIELPEETIAPGVEDVLGAGAEYRVIVPSTYLMPPADEPVLIIGIAAVGGGTDGNYYTNQTWMWDLWAGSELIASGRDLHTGALPKRHDEAARALAAFLSADGECLHYEPECEEGELYCERARTVLAEAWEQLGLFASDDE